MDLRNAASAVEGLVFAALVNEGIDSTADVPASALVPVYV